MTSPSRPTESLTTEDQVQEAVDRLSSELKATYLMECHKNDISTVLTALSEARAELAESARLHGMGSEREAALLAKLDQAKRELSAEKVHHIHTAQCLREELAESEAKVKEIQGVEAHLCKELNFECESRDQNARLFEEEQALRIKAESELAEASAKIEELAIGHARYEYLRKLNPRQFTELYQQNISTAVPFDTLVDEARVATREASRAPTAGENNERKDFV